MTDEPVYDIAHLGHLEMLTPKFEESRKFFIDVMGMTQSGEQGDSVYLRGWDDYERYSLKLTASKTSGMAHVAFRTRSPQALERRAAALKGSGFEVGWTDGDLGHGKTFVCRDPDGHVIELYYDTEWYDPPPDKKPALKNQAQRYPARGCNVRRIDHFNGLAADIKAGVEAYRNGKFATAYAQFLSAAVAGDAVGVQDPHREDLEVLSRPGREARLRAVRGVEGVEVLADHRRGRTVAFDAAVVDPEAPRAEVADHGHVVADEEDRASLPGDGAHLAHALLAEGRVPH